ncbi:MAG: helicase, partial [Alphaproteobacteria bacterium]|nr:helicase [Alphaproteobacteria bacterium]
MTRQHADDILKPLKPFQRRTVDHAFRRLFLDADSTSRFLVADEVGLGKTLVARGIIARTIDHLWDDVGRIDIIYICSNAGIARANLPKLQIGGERSFALATRLTMLATELAPRDNGPGFMDNKLN